MREIKAKVVAWNKDKDLALLKLDILRIGVRALPLARETENLAEVTPLATPEEPELCRFTRRGQLYLAPSKKNESKRANGIVNHDAWVIETQSPTNPGDSNNLAYQ